MNESTPERQLTRRELRELATKKAETGEGVEYTNTDTAGFSVNADPAFNEAQLAVVRELESKVDVSRVDADGNQLDRRALRRARTAEYERLLTEWENENGPLAEYGTVPASTADHDAEQAVDALHTAEEDTVSTVEGLAESANTAAEATADEAADIDAEAVYTTSVEENADSNIDETVPDGFAADAEAEDEVVAADEDVMFAPVSAAQAANTDAAESTEQEAVESDETPAHLQETQALTVAEIAEAEGRDPEELAAADEAAAIAAADETPAKKRKWPWSKKTKPETHGAAFAADEDSVAAVLEDETPAAVAETAEVTSPEVAAPEADVDDAETSQNAAEAEVLVPATDAEQVEAEAEIAAEPAADDELDAVADAEATSADESNVEYSFPDIAPLDDHGSVFDEGSQRNLSADSGFDNLINRAVEDETSTTVTTGTAALILPTLPEEAELAGALDENSGVFVSGSIQLPQSVGETGGHHSLHGSEAGEAEVLDEIFETSSTTQPLSALKAVSSRHAQTEPMLGEAKTDNSKGPLIFMITGGALIVAAGAVVVGAFNGMFG